MTLCHRITTTEVSAKLKVVILPQTPYSSDLAPSGCFLFSRIKKDLKEKRFDTILAIQVALTRSLNSLVREDFQGAYEQWKKR